MSSETNSGTVLSSAFFYYDSIIKILRKSSSSSLALGMTVRSSGFLEICT